MGRSRKSWCCHIAVLQLLLSYATLIYAVLWPSSYDYIMADFTLCQRMNPDVVVWVQGRASMPGHRMIIREIMSNQKVWPQGVRVATLFFVGQVPLNESVQNLLEYEYELYGDIVQNDYIEHYRNQTAKMMSAINFIADYCSKIKLAIRIDDDVVFVPSIMITKLVDILIDLHMLKRYPKISDRFAQQVNVKSMSISQKLHHLPVNTVSCKYLKKQEIGRRSTQSYPLDPSILPGRIIYPDYCAGFFIAFTADLLRIFQLTFSKQQPFWIDDAYLGVLQERVDTFNLDLDNLLLFTDPSNGSTQTYLHNSALSSTPIAIHLEQPHYNKHIGEAGFLNFRELAYKPTFDDFT